MYTAATALQSNRVLGAPRQDTQGTQPVEIGCWAPDLGEEGKDISSKRRSLSGPPQITQWGGFCFSLSADSIPLSTVSAGGPIGRRPFGALRVGIQKRQPETGRTGQKRVSQAE